MKCSNCGHENTSDASFCKNCNDSLGTTTAGASLATGGVPVSSATPGGSPVPVTPSAYSAAPSPAPSITPAFIATPNQAPPATPAYNPPQSYNSAQAYNSASARPVPYTYPHPYYYPLAPAKQKQPFSITDAYIIIGFILSVIGIFAYAFILLPAGIGFSVVGFVRRTNARTLGLSVAGIVVGVVACFIRVGMLLNELGVIPDWLSSGIF